MSIVHMHSMLQFYEELITKTLRKGIGSYVPILTQQRSRSLLVSLSTSLCGISKRDGLIDKSDSMVRWQA